MIKNSNKGLSNTVYAVIAAIIIVIIAVGAYIAIDNPFGGTTNNTLPAASLTGGGSSFVYPLMSNWTAYFYNLNPTVQITYQSVGSGTGQKNLFNYTFDFAGSDPPLTSAQLATYTNIVEIPEACGGVTMAYNLPGIPMGLNLTANVIAEIFQGNITNWNDPQIQSLNPGFTMPNMAIVPVHRSDSSGTTNIVSSYLSNASNVWVSGHGNTINWPNGQQSGAQNSGVAAVVKQISGSIGYIEYFYAASNAITFANIQDHDGQFVTPSLTTIAAATNAGAPLLQSNIGNLIVNLPGSNVYPISSFTYIFVYTNMTYLGHDKAIDLANFISWCVNKGQVYGPPLYYPQLPSSIVTLANNAINTLTYGGSAITIYQQNK
jgi:phosphate transport system substrate-binding protein